MSASQHAQKSAATGPVHIPCAPGRSRLVVFGAGTPPMSHLLAPDGYATADQIDAAVQTQQGER
jgi:hypothetical protein